MLSKQKSTHVYSVSGNRKKKFTMKGSNILASTKSTEIKGSTLQENISERSLIQELIPDNSYINSGEEYSEASQNMLESAIRSRHNIVRAQLRDNTRTSYSNIISYYMGNTAKCIHTDCSENGVWRCITCTKSMHISSSSRKSR